MLGFQQELLGARHRRSALQGPGSLAAHGFGQVEFPAASDLLLGCLLLRIGFLGITHTHSLTNRAP